MPTYDDVVRARAAQKQTAAGAYMQSLSPRQQLAARAGLMPTASPYGTANGRGGYQDLGIDPGAGDIRKQIIASRMQNQHVDPRYNMVQPGRAAVLEILAARDRANQPAPFVSPLEGMSFREKLAHVQQNAVPIPRMTAEAMGHYHEQQERKQSVKERILAYKASQSRGGRPVPPVSGPQVTPFVWDRQQPKMAQSVKFIQHLMSQEGLPPQQALMSLKQHYSDQELEQIASEHSPGWGVSDFGDWVLGGESDALLQRKSRSQWLANVGILPPGQTQVPPAPIPRSAAERWGAGVPQSLPQLGRWKSGFEM
jgi:hypothetical protein